MKQNRADKNSHPPWKYGCCLTRPLMFLRWQVRLKSKTIRISVQLQAVKIFKFLHVNKLKLHVVWLTTRLTEDKRSVMIRVSTALCLSHQKPNVRPLTNRRKHHSLLLRIKLANAQLKPQERQPPKPTKRQSNNPKLCERTTKKHRKSKPCSVREILLVRWPPLILNQTTTAS